MLKSCFENWTFGYLPGLLSRLYCTRSEIVWENLEKLNDGGLLPGLRCEQKTILTAEAFHTSREEST